MGSREQSFELAQVIIPTLDLVLINPALEILVAREGDRQSGIATPVTPREGLQFQ